jgi:hypothetical protein
MAEMVIGRFNLKALPVEVVVCRMLNLVKGLFFIKAGETA